MPFCTTESDRSTPSSLLIKTGYFAITVTNHHLSSFLFTWIFSEDERWHAAFHSFWIYSGHQLYIAQSYTDRSYIIRSSRAHHPVIFMRGENIGYSFSSSKQLYIFLGIFKWGASLCISQLEDSSWFFNRQDKGWRVEIWRAQFLMS